MHQTLHVCGCFSAAHSYCCAINVVHLKHIWCAVCFSVLFRLAGTITRTVGVGYPFCRDGGDSLGGPVVQIHPSHLSARRAHWQPSRQQQRFPSSLAHACISYHNGPSVPCAISGAMLTRRLWAPRGHSPRCLEHLMYPVSKLALLEM